LILLSEQWESAHLESMSILNPHIEFV
jgi:hypothetical protein